MIRRIAATMLSAGSLFLFFVLLSSCASIQVNKLPSPPPTAKLRVYIRPYSTPYEGKGKWGDTPEVYAEKQIRIATKFLSATGIYEVVSPEDVRAVLRDQNPTHYQMEQNDWALAREIGKALYADYVMVMERGTIGITNTQYFSNALINVATGRKFGALYSFPRSGGLTKYKMRDIMRASYRDIFRSAKDDLLAAAMRKSERLADPNLTTESKPPSSRKPDDRDWMQRFDEQRVLAQDAEGVKGNRARLVVYDLDAPELYKPAALILSEALREELFLLKQFILVNREDLESLLKEMALQQTGLIDDKEAVKTGKGLAANQVITGKLGLLGKTYVLQAKRIDVETLTTLSISSVKFSQGQEEKILDKMPEMARTLAGRQ